MMTHADTSLVRFQTQTMRNVTFATHEASLYRCSASLRFLEACQQRQLFTENSGATTHHPLASGSNYGGQRLVGVT